MQKRSMKLFLGLAGAALVGLVGMPSAGEDSSTPSASSALPVAPAALAIAPVPAFGELSDPGRGARSQADLQERQFQRGQTLTWGRDPFAGPVVIAPEVEQVQVPVPELPRLSGMSAVGTRRRAILDRQIVSPGDVLPSGWSVQLIEQGLVTLRFESQVRVLQLRKDP